MIQLSSAAMRYGDKVLFEGLDWLIGPQDRIGVVGANGSGKTTLLRILLGTERLDRGSMTAQKGLQIGYLPQDGLSLAGRTLFAECLSAFDEALALEKEQEELTHKMGELDPESAAYASVADRFQWVTDRYHALDGYTKEAQVGSVLDGLAFPKSDWDRPIEEFSGGWQMRIALGKLLLEKPNLLLLDEPTNHLDLEARNWLESYLGAYRYAFLVISHDRYFLDVTVKKIIEVWNKKVHFYTGGYSRYETLKQERIEQLEAAHKNQQDRVHHLETFINRFRYQATKAAQVQSRVKELAKIERIELPRKEATMHFRFPQPGQSGRKVMELSDAAKSYGKLEVLRDTSFVIERGDRITLIGENGAGKSTLIRMLAGIEPLTRGERIEGQKVGIDYFAQDQYKVLDPEARILDDLIQVAPRSNDRELRSLLGCFLFSGDDVYKPIGVLSGGERNRYALARVLIKPSNFLLLDEPTNHLDMRAKDVLLRALLEFNGTLAFVSHDRYFIDKLATKIFAIGGGEVRVYPGNYEDYLWQSERAGEAGRGTGPGGKISDSLQAALDFNGREKSSQRGNATERANGAKPKAKRRMNPIQTERIRKQIAGAEGEIERFEAEIGELQSDLNAAASDHKQAAEIVARMAELREQMAESERRWEELHQRLEPVS